MKKAKIVKKTEKESGISFDYCGDNLKECIKRNKFYNQVRKNLMRNKLIKQFGNQIEEQEISN